MYSRRTLLRNISRLVAVSALGVKAAPVFGRNQHVPRRGVIAIGFDIERMFESEEPYFTDNPPPLKSVSYPGPKWQLTPACIQYVRKLMDIADRHSTKVQFFALGHSVEASPDIFSEILARKHALGQHTYSHLSLNANTNQVMDEVFKTQEIFFRKLGLRPIGLRAPGMYSHGIDALQELQGRLKTAGIRYVSTRYDQSRSMEEMQPYLLPSGLLEIPSFGYSDRNYTHKLQNTLQAWTSYIRDQVRQACDRKLIYTPDLHPCLEAVLDPQAETLETIIAAAHGVPNPWTTTFDALARSLLGAK